MEKPYVQRPRGKRKNDPKEILYNSIIEIKLRRERFKLRCFQHMLSVPSNRKIPLGPEMTVQTIRLGPCLFFSFPRSNPSPRFHSWHPNTCTDHLKVTISASQTYPLPLHIQRRKQKRTVSPISRKILRFTSVGQFRSHESQVLEWTDWPHPHPLLNPQNLDRINIRDTIVSQQKPGILCNGKRKIECTDS